MAFLRLRRPARSDAAPSADPPRSSHGAALYPVGGVVPGLALATSRALRARA